MHDEPARPATASRRGRGPGRARAARRPLACPRRSSASPACASQSGSTAPSGSASRRVPEALDRLAGAGQRPAERVRGADARRRRLAARASATACSGSPWSASNTASSTSASTPAARAAAARAATSARSRLRRLSGRQLRLTEGDDVLGQREPLDQDRRRRSLPCVVIEPREAQLGRGVARDQGERLGEGAARRGPAAAAPLQLAEQRVARRRCSPPPGRPRPRPGASPRPRPARSPCSSRTYETRA